MNAPRLPTLLIATSMLCAGCAVAPMKDDTYAVMLQNHVASLDRKQVCCASWQEVDVSRTLTAQGVEVNLADNDVQVREFGNGRAPVVGFKLPHAGVDAIEVFSYSHEYVSLMRFDNRLFVRPDIFLLDAEGRVIDEIRNPTMCFGRLGKGGGVWTRVPIDAPDAAYAIVSPSVQVPDQTVDTRILGDIPPGIQAIADARGKTYLGTVRFGYIGLMSVRAVDPGTAPLGRCVPEAD